ncbi:hypothetical protein RN001_001849, partial [Aquatica leii]
MLLETYVTITQIVDLRWGFVIHGCIDGYSILMIYLSCKTPIQAESVLQLFLFAINIQGIPSRVRSDHGYENSLVTVFMNLIRGLGQGSHITGKSVHNQRNERLWCDVFKEVIDKIYTEFHNLEENRLFVVDSGKRRY